MRAMTMALALAVASATTVVVGAAADTTGRLVSLTRGPGPAVAVGLTTTARVTLTAVIDEPRGPVTAPHASVLKSTGGFTTSVALVAQSQSGSVGTYVGSAGFSSTDAGDWRVVAVQWRVGAAEYSQDPRTSTATDVAIRIEGHDAPRVASVLIPAAVPYGARQWAQLTYRDSSGKPIAGWPVAFGTGVQCVGGNDMSSGWWPTPRLRTDSLGRVTLRLSSPSGAGIACVRLATSPTATPGGQVGLLTSGIHRWESYKSVTIGVTTHRTRTGSTFYVKGVVVPRSSGIMVQRLTGRRWVVVAEGNTRRDGSYRIPVTAAAGRHAMRVVTTKGGYRPIASRVVYVTGTR